ncbi:MAG: helix-turn-helix domain containing protein [Flavobacteriaceae bacterium]|jgi:hypothetical protein|nr:helix-turn-helix domain containing protein [Flavobacteriaceae bacterium]
MLDATAVLKKLKKILGIKTDLQLSNLLDVKPNTISSWKKRNSLQYENLIALCKEHKIDLNALFFENYRNEKELSKEGRLVKMISTEQYFEYFLDSAKTLASAPSYVFPTVDEIDTAFQVSSNNMFPTIKVTSYVLTKKITIEEMQPWHVYLFIMEGKGLFIYRFKKYTELGKLHFVSDNHTYTSIDVDPADIREVFCVRGGFLPDFKVVGDI